MESSSPLEETAAAASAVDKIMEDMVLKMLARVEAGEDVENARKTRKVVRLSEEQCRRVAAITPWPPVVPLAMFDLSRYDAIQDPERREEMRGRKVRAIDNLRAYHAELARVCEQYAAYGYAETAMDVDEHGVEYLAVL